MILRLAALVVIATAVFFIGRAATPIVEQNRKVREWPKVTATVTARFVEPPKRAGAAGTGSELVIPAQRLHVEYAHEANGTLYRRIVFNPRAEEWAPTGPRLISERQASYTREGYYDPARPNELFLPDALGIGDYWPTFFWGPLLGIGFAGLVLRKGGYSARAPMDRAGDGWYELRPKYPLRVRAGAAWAVAVVCNAVVGLATYDYFAGEPRERTSSGIILTTAAQLPGLIAIAVAVYYTLLARRVRDARAFINAARVQPGTRLKVRVELPVTRAVKLEHVTITLACIRSAIEGRTGRSKWRQRVIWEQGEESAIARTARGGASMHFHAELRVPDDALPSSAAGLFGPWIDWEIRVAFQLDDGPDYRGKFAVAVDV